ncbi:M23 family metallopeptidase [Nocardia tengchongensis]|uniref:M23 family metallopeptidase n=1 Tax=Nocardia tengchongensis TaxID=2055889 RepID=A0ABX8CK35_9NOCA|nr:M23 family metallopeptidase [Nocardia tengchongensis]QVI19752.1 M23 family metallopeptidase [Nocardia tengchongensis]
MPVTDSLSRFRGTSRYRAAATRAAAVTALVGASMAALAATSPDATHDAVAIASASADTQFTAFTPREAQEPQIVPQPVLDYLNSLNIQLPPLPGLPTPGHPATVRPVDGPLTSGFGIRWGAMHAGIDFGEGFGAPIRAVTDGTVIEAGPASGFGLWVRVQQDDGTIGVYGHMQDILVQVGQPLRAGDVLATVGSRGYSTGPHLHYEVHTAPGAPIDPIGWLAARGVDFGVPAAD